MQNLFRLQLIASGVLFGSLITAPAAKSVDMEPACSTVCTTSGSGGNGGCTFTAEGPRTRLVNNQTVTLWDYFVNCDFDLDHFEIGFPGNKDAFFGESPPDTEVTDRCEGGLVSNENDCSDKVALFKRFNEANGLPATIGAYGDWLPQEQGACGKKGNKEECCAICGIGIGAPQPDPRIAELLMFETQLSLGNELCQIQYDATANNNEGAIVSATGPFCNITNDGEGFLVGGPGTETGLTLAGVSAGDFLTIGVFPDTGRGSNGSGTCGYQFVKETGRIYLVCTCGEKSVDEICTDYEKAYCPTGTRCQDSF